MQKDPMETARQLSCLRADTEKKCYRLAWKGSKIPRGAKVGDVEIGWAQNGLITGKGGERLGEYERLKEFAGVDGDQHEMLVFCSEPVRHPDGMLCDTAN